MRFCDNKTMLLLVKTRILTFWMGGGGGGGGMSSTVTNIHVTVSQNWIENKLKTILKQKKKKKKGDAERLTEKERIYSFHF